MAWKQNSEAMPGTAKVSASSAKGVTFEKWSGASYSSGKGIPKTKTGGMTPTKQIAGNMSTKYSQKDTTSSNVE